MVKTQLVDINEGRDISFFAPFASIALVWLMLALRDIAGVNVNRYIILAVCAVGMFLSNMHGANCIVFAMLPLMSGIPSTYIFTMYTCIRIIKRASFKAISVFMAIFAAIFEVFASLFYQYSTTMNLINHIVGVSIFFVLLNEYENERYEEILKYYIYSTAVVCAIIIINGLINAPSNWLELFAKGWFRFGATESENLTGMKLSLNANTLGYYSISGMSLCLMMMRRCGFKEKVLQILCFVVCLLAGILSLSRTWMLVTAIMVLLYMLINFRTLKSAVISGTIVAACLIFIFIQLQKNPEIINGYITRFTDDTMTTGSNRTNAFAEYLNKFLSNIRVMIFGAGCVEYKTVLDMELSVHNGTEQLLVCYGIVGTVIFLYGMLNPLLKNCKNKHKRAVYWIPMIVTLLYVQTIQFVAPTYLLMPYIPAAYSVYLGARDQC